MSEPRLIFVISDATGETAEKVVRAALLQFTDVPVQLRMYTRVRLEAEMRSIINRAKHDAARWSSSPSCRRRTASCCAACATRRTSTRSISSAR